MGNLYSPISDLLNDPALAEALGNMVIAWARVDVEYIQLFRVITDTSWPMASAAYYRIPTFEARTKVLIAMIEMWPPSPSYDREKIADTILKLSRLSKTRNDWVHGSWHKQVSTPDGKGIVIFDYRQPLKTAGRRKPVKAADIWNHVGAVHARIIELIDLRGRAEQVSRGSSFDL
jgi:hypothetical protein